MTAETAIAPTTPNAGLPASLAAASDRAANYAAEASSPNTRRAYRGDWRCWTAWCDQHGIVPLPAHPASVGAYMADRIGTLSIATLVRRLSAISVAHQLAGLHLDTRSPAIRQVMAGIKRTHGTAPRRVRAATTAIIRDLIATCGDSIIDQRDKALLLVGFAGAFRRSELVMLDVQDVEFVSEGVRVQIGKSKSDQEGEGATVGIHTTGSVSCPVNALAKWLEVANITNGRIFRAVDRHGRISNSMTGEAVAMAVQRRAKLAGLNPVEFGGHSLRAGLATSAAAAGLQEGDVQRQTRHKSIAVLRSYVRHGGVFVRNVSGSIGL